MILIEKLQNKIDHFRTLLISWTKFVKVCQINGEKIKGFTNQAFNVVYKKKLNLINEQ